MESPTILNILIMAKRYRQRPSDILGVTDDYAAYCFDEACIFLYNALEEGKELHFKGDGIDKKPKHYKTVSEFYKSLGVSGNGI